MSVFELVHDDSRLDLIQVFYEGFRSVNFVYCDGLGIVLYMVDDDLVGRLGDHAALEGLFSPDVSADKIEMPGQVGHPL